MSYVDRPQAILTCVNTLLTVIATYTLILRKCSTLRLNLYRLVWGLYTIPGLFEATWSLFSAFFVIFSRLAIMLSVMWIQSCSWIHVYHARRNRQTGEDYSYSNTTVNSDSEFTWKVLVTITAEYNYLGQLWCDVQSTLYT